MILATCYRFTIRFFPDTQPTYNLIYLPLVAQKLMPHANFSNLKVLDFDGWKFVLTKCTRYSIYDSKNYYFPLASDILSLSHTVFYDWYKLFMFVLCLISSISKVWIISHLTVTNKTLYSKNIFGYTTLLHFWKK